MENKMIAVLFGGQANEHPVSLMSAASILRNMPAWYDTYLVGITRDGRWYHYKGEIDDIENGKWEEHPDNEEVILSPNADHHGFYQLDSHTIQRVDVILPVLHGRHGEDGTVQGLCQLNGIPFVSCSMTSSALVMDKHFTHVICESAGVLMAKYMVLRRHEQYDVEELFHEVEQKLGLPCYVKPVSEGSSFGAHKVSNFMQFQEYLADAFSYDDKILIEEFIDGYEVGAGVMGYGGDVKAGEVFEIIVSSEMYGYAEKYEGYKTVINTPAKTISRELQERIQSEAVKIYRLLDCDMLARVDFFYGSKGLVFNEVNSIPGFTSHSLYPASFKAAGMSYSNIIDQLIKLALDRK
ncbi:MAG: D-alanine--D-alanine ligase [Erysipelotrichaceae bacterium]|nr:D-alanine--D-alanine ligase [Erysipelotrichaceae bacterium]